MRGSVSYRLVTVASFLAIVFCLDHPCFHAPAAPPNDAKDEPQFTNRLAKETSPYLLMHAHNPVDWYPWGPEAFAKAKKEGKLIFLSIGYSSCYWCHVMERESFDNPKVAKLLNKWFVSIKVDREERPDVDNVYMTALTEVMGQNGGWPLSMFLTADGKPIVGGTYFPPEDLIVDGKLARRGFKSVLKALHELYLKDPKDVQAHATLVANRTKAALEAPTKGIALVDVDRDLIHGVVEVSRNAFDKTYGGFGSPARDFNGPKFPTPCRLEFLLHEGRMYKENSYIEMVTLTLDKMARGGIYDHIGGGFHRYSTERTWTVPHFEKMLYDNGQLLEIYAKAYRHTKKPLYKRVLRETLDYLKREMMSPEGAFYSSQDAETHEEEGRFYVWTGAELAKAIPDNDDLKFVKTVYNATGKPNFEEKYYILHLKEPLAEIAKDLGMTEKSLLAKLEPLKKQLFQVREKREKPFLNKIALTGWSGLAIAGFAEAGKALGEPKYIKTAEQAADFVLEKQVTSKGRLLRTYGAQPGKKPKAAVAAYLQDYAFLVHGLLALHDVTGKDRWLKEAEKLTKVMVENHGDDKEGGYYFTAHDSEKLFARSKDQFDGATPSANSMAMRNLVRLWKETGKEFYKKEAKRGFDSFARSMDNYPYGLSLMANALSMYLDDVEDKGIAKPGIKVKDLSLPGQEGKKEKKKEIVEMKVKAGKVADGKQTITVTLTIQEGWHIYANPVGSPDLAGAETKIKVGGKGKPKVIKIGYPKGKKHKSDVVGSYQVYENKVDIPVMIQRTGEEPVEVSVRFQSCNENVCLLPKTLKKVVK